MILTTPLFKDLKRIFPDSELSVLASTINSDIAKNLGCVDYTYEYSKKVSSTAKLILTLRRKAFDYWIDPKDEFSNTSKILEKLCKPKISIGFNIKEKVFDINLRNFVKGEHRVDINLSPVSYLSENNEYKIVLPHIDIPSVDAANIQTQLIKIQGTKVLLNLSTGIEARNLGVEKWIEVVNGIDENKNIIITGMKKDYEKINAVLDACRLKAILFVKTKTIFELAELIKQCSLLITPDTSAVHLASCFNTPIVSMFNNVKWNQVKFSPLSEKQRIIVSDEENSFKSIEPDQVIKAVYELLT